MSQVRSGDKLNIKASDWNDLMTMLRHWRKTRGTGFTLDGVSGLGPAIVQVKNTTASTVAQYGVLALDEPIVLRSSDANAFRDNGIAFKGISPSTSTPHYGKFAVLQAPALAGQFAPAIIAGLTWVNLTIADADDVAAEITNGVTGALTTGMHGSARILWKESGTGSGKMGLVMLGGWAEPMLGKTDAEILKADDGSVSIWSGVEGSEVDTGVNVTAYNRFATVASGKWVMVHSVNGRLYLIAAECG